MLKNALDFILAYQYFLVSTGALMAVIETAKRMPVVKAWFKEEAWFREYVMPWVPMFVVALLGSTIESLRPEGMSAGVGAITGVLFGAFASAIFKGFKSLFRGLANALRNKE